MEATKDDTVSANLIVHDSNGIHTFFTYMSLPPSFPPSSLIPSPHKVLNLKNIKKIAHDHGLPFSKARSLGEYLDIPQHILDDIEHDCRKSEEIFTEVINHWLHNCEDPSWDKLAVALGYCGYKKIGDHIRSFSTASLQDDYKDSAIAGMSSLLFEFWHFMHACFVR